MSRQLDRMHRSVSVGAILRNAEVHSLFASAHFWKETIAIHSVFVKRNPFTLPVKLGRRRVGARL
jgi:hypothetical protein